MQQNLQHLQLLQRGATHLASVGEYVGNTLLVGGRVVAILDEGGEQLVIPGGRRGHTPLPVDRTQAAKQHLRIVGDDTQQFLMLLLLCCLIIPRFIYIRIFLIVLQGITTSVVVDVVIISAVGKGSWRGCPVA